MSQPLFTLETSPPSWSRTSVYLFIFVYFLVLLILIIFFSFCVLLQRWDLTVRIKIKGILNNIPLWLTLPGHYCGNPKACTKTWTLDDGRWTVDDGRWTMDDGRWTMDDGGRLCFCHAILSGNTVTQDLREKGFLQRLCVCHAISKYFVSRLCHTKKDLNR